MITYISSGVLETILRYPFRNGKTVKSSRKHLLMPIKKQIKMKAAIFYTNNFWSATILRLLLGLVLLGHGAQKLLGWFSGYGFDGTMGFFTGTIGLPWIIGFLVIVIEFFG